MALREVILATNSEVEYSGSTPGNHPIYSSSVVAPTTTTTTLAPTTTTTTLAPTTTTTTLAPTTTTTTTLTLTFDTGYTCVGVVNISGSNPTGGSGSGYQFGNWVFDTEAAALANTIWTTTTFIDYGSGDIDSTWWIVLRDGLNNRKAISVTSNCGFTTTTTTVI